MDDTTSLRCGSGQIECDGLCVDPQTDESYCGASGACGDGGGSAGEACEAGFACVAGACEVSCAGCLIGGECYADGSLNPDNTCQVCDIAADRSAFVNDDGRSCSDGLTCTTNDMCSAGACVGGAALECDDGVACNGVESCDEDQDRCVSSGSTCTGGDVCDVEGDSCVATCGESQVECDGLCIDPQTDESFCGASDTCDAEAGTAGVACEAGFACVDGGCEPTCAGCLVDGECYADGTLNPDNSCQVCDITVDRTAFVDDDGRICEDGLLCTTNDTCNAGACVGGPARACDDGIACNGAETCDEALGCVSPGDACTNGGVCDVASDSCVAACDGCLVDGLCIADGGFNPATRCEVCDVATTAVGYVPTAPYTSGLAVTSAATGGAVTSTAGTLTLQEGADPRQVITLIEDLGNPGVYTVSDVTGAGLTRFLEAVLATSLATNLLFPGTLTETSCGTFEVTAPPQSYLGVTWTPGFEVVPASYSGLTELTIHWFIVDNPGLDNALEPFEATTVFTIPDPL